MTHIMRAAKIAALLVLVSMVSFGGTITVDIVASIGPSPNSSNLATYESNAEYALQNGFTTWGASNTPAYYSQAGSPINPLGFITTNYPSWLGNNSPTGAYSTETGNAVFFGLTAVASSGTFDINDISFFLTGNGTTQLGTSGLGVQFSQHTVGFNGPTYYNNTFGSASLDDNTPLTAFYTSGIFVDTVAGDPTLVAGLIAGLDSMGNVASYTIQGNNTMQITFDVTPSSVPEPSTFVLLGLGLAGMAGLRRRFASR